VNSTLPRGWPNQRGHLKVDRSSGTEEPCVQPCRFCHFHIQDLCQDQCLAAVHHNKDVKRSVIGLKLSAYKVYLWYTAGTAFAFALMTTVSSLYAIEDVHLSGFQLLMVGFTLEISCFVFEVPTGVLADVVSRKLSMVIGLALMGAGFLLMGVVPAFWVILLAQVLWGSGITFMSGADDAWIADELGREALQRVFLRGAQVNQVATLCGIFVSVGLATWHLNIPLVVAGGLFVLYAAWVNKFLPESRANVSEPKWNPRPAVVSNPWQDLWRTLTKGLQLVWRRPVLRIIVAIGVVTGLYSEGLDRLWTLHLLNRFTFPHVGRFHDVLWFGLISAGALILNIFVVGWLRNRLERTGKLAKVWVLLIMNTLLIAGIALFAVSRWLPAAVMAFWFVQILRGTNAPLYAALMNEQIDDSSVRATILSSQGQWYALGEIGGGLLVAAIVWRSSVVAGLLTSSAILVMAVALYVYVLRKIKVYGNGSDEGMPAPE
jgi:DHA3 family tetracycline resistance protein-like MFS transporter